MSTPVVPPRPQRSQAAPAAGETPVVPPRPIRKQDLEDDREEFTRSPLNSLPGTISHPPAASARSEADLPRRPPSVVLPGIGQEGSEYSSYDQLPQEATIGQTKNVSADLPMHQPVASVPQSTASRQIQTVTRTDSATAAAAGIGRQLPAESTQLQPAAAEGNGSPLARTTSNTAGGRRPSSVEPQHPLRTQASFNRSTSSFQPLERSTSRPGSVHGEHHEYGIPEIGQRIPLYKNAGDVQAPSPAPGQTQHTPGIGFFNDGSSRNHNRKRSTRQEFGPPDSYGLRHDQDHQDQFERAWQAKHPEQAAKEESFLHLPRPPSALTSEQLNRLVDQTGPGSDAFRSATPDEEDVLDATEEFIARRSPLKNKEAAGAAGSESRSELGADDHVVHVYRNNARRTSRISVGSVDHLHEHADQGYASDRDMPILAADEVIKRPGSAYMHAAVNPVDSHGEEYDDEYGNHSSSRRNSAQLASRPGSVHGTHLDPHAAATQKQLAEIEEYDPLFPDDDDGKKKPQKTVANRPDLSLMHHFPSRDTWEDTPDSLHYSAEVSTPDIEREQPEIREAAASTTFETPEAEANRIARNPDSMLSDNKTFIKPNFKTGSREHLHGVPKFPSSDVWEDTPNSMYLETTVSGPQIDETKVAPDDASSPTSSRPIVPARPDRSSKPATDGSAAARPNIPARPVRSSQTSGDVDPAAAAKVKPAVPARPSGEKFGNLRGNAGFLSDLNNRLKLGPQAIPTKKEPEADAAVTEEPTPRAPLADARKGRAKGPMRRKPGATTELKSASFALSPLITVWSIDEEDELQVESDNTAEHPAATPAAEEPVAAESEKVEDVATTVS